MINMIFKVKELNVSKMYLNMKSKVLILQEYSIAHSIFLINQSMSSILLLCLCSSGSIFNFILRYVSKRL